MYHVSAQGVDERMINIIIIIMIIIMIIIVLFLQTRCRWHPHYP